MTKRANLKWCAIGNDLVTHFQARKNPDKDVWVRIRENEFKEMSRKRWQFSFFDKSLVNRKETAKYFGRRFRYNRKKYRHYFRRDL